MKIQFAGVGSAFTTQDYWQSNMVVTAQDKHMLIDCGSDARFSLKEIGLSYRDIDAIYISHLHADHIGGLEWLGFSTYFDPKCRKPTMFIVESLISDLWGSLKAGMQSHEGVVLTLESFFNVVPIKINNCFEFGDANFWPIQTVHVNFWPIQTVHVINGYGIVHSYGLMIESGSGRKSFLTTDTQFCPRQIEKFYHKADIIFQDCETAPYRSGVHAHYDDLKTLEPSVKSKMWLYHYQPNPQQDPKQDGFGGFISKGDDFEL
jgi:ribonuclease BN (tRNA processing enzyme)